MDDIILEAVFFGNSGDIFYIFIYLHYIFLFLFFLLLYTIFILCYIFRAKTKQILSIYFYIESISHIFPHILFFLEHFSSGNRS